MKGRRGKAPATEPDYDMPPLENIDDTSTKAGERDVVRDGDAALRTRRWVESGGARAVGEDFLGASPVPARTETEGRYEKDSRPGYRVAGVVCKSDL